MENEIYFPSLDESLTTYEHEGSRWVFLSDLCGKFGIDEAPQSEITEVWKKSTLGSRGMRWINLERRGGYAVKAEPFDDTGYTKFALFPLWELIKTPLFRKRVPAERIYKIKAYCARLEQIRLRWFEEYKENKAAAYAGA